MAYGAYAGNREDESHCPKGDGGDTGIRNQDERMIHEKVDAAALKSPRMVAGYQPEDFH